jgi:hypothetical protein
MKKLWLFAPILLASSAFAQNVQPLPQPLPQSLPQLAAVLPSLVHNKQFQLGPFSDAVDEAIRHDPASIPAAAAIAAKDLQDPDPAVKANVLGLMHAIAVTHQGASALQVAADAIAQVLTQGDDLSQRMALLVATDLNQQAPDSFIAPLEQLVQAANTNDTIRTRAATALGLCRPKDETAQNLISKTIDNTALPQSVRNEILFHSASLESGSILTDNAVRLANTAIDKSIRDSAILAVTRMGPNVVERVRKRLEAIQNDSTESLYSHNVSDAALQSLR